MITLKHYINLYLLYSARMSISPRQLEKYRENGSDLYTYMCSQFCTKDIDKYNYIKYFEIRDFPNKYSYRYLDKITEECEAIIQPDLLQWIRQERDTEKLFDKTNWKICSETWDYTRAYIGYKILFPYKQYYFQLIIDYFYNFDHSPNEDGNELHLQLGFYGWKDISLEYIQPDNTYIMPSDMSIPEWDKKYFYSLE